MKHIIIIFFIWRIFLFLPLFAGHEFIPYRSGYEYTNIWKFIKPYPPVDNFLLYPWSNFDGVHYLLIAGEGYSNNGGFFPLYPMLINLISSVFGKVETYEMIQFFTAFFISNISFLASLTVFYKLLRIDFSERTAFWSIIFLLAFPTSFFFASIYSESLFFLLLVLSFYFARKKEWTKAGLFAMFLTATRLVGITIFPVLIYIFLKEERKTLKSLPLYLTPLGLIGYSIFNKLKWNDWFYFIHAQGNFANNRSVDNIIFIPQTVFRYIKILINNPFSYYEWWIALLEISVFILVLFFLYIAWKKKIHYSYILYSILSFIVPTLSGTFSGLPRYSLVLFPIFIVPALIFKTPVKIIYISISIILLFILLMFFSRGYYIA